MFKKTLIAAALVAVAALGTDVSATTATGTFQVQLQITKTCTVNTTGSSNITFATTVSGGTVNSNSGAFSVNCSNTTPFNVGLQSGNNASTSGAGTMKGATSGNTSTIPYQLYSNSGLSTVWGNTATATSVGNGVAGTGAGMSAAKAVPYTVYAALTGTSPSDVTPDTYADTVTINVNF